MKPATGGVKTKESARRKNSYRLFGEGRSKPRVSGIDSKKKKKKKRNSSI